MSPKGSTTLATKAILVARRTVATVQAVSTVESGVDIEVSGKLFLHESAGDNCEPERFKIKTYLSNGRRACVTRRPIQGTRWRKKVAHPMGSISRLIPATSFKAVAPCASPAQCRVLGLRGPAALLVCRSVDYNWALLGPIEGIIRSDLGPLTRSDGEPSCAR